MWDNMNKEFNKIKENRGTILEENESIRLDNEQEKHHSRKLFNNIGDLYYCDSEEKAIEILVKNTYDILCIFADMNLQPDYFFDLIIKDKISELNGDRVLPYSDVRVGLTLLNKFGNKTSDYDIEYYYNIISNINKKYKLTNEKSPLAIIKESCFKMINLVYEYNDANDIVDDIVALMQALYINVDVFAKINFNPKDMLDNYINQNIKTR